MQWLEIVRVLWPIAVVLTPLICASGFLWLRTQFVTKQDLDTAKDQILEEIEKHETRLNAGSEKMADFDKRIALVEDDCESAPTKGDLNQGMSVLAGRMTGVETGLRGVEKMLGTANDYLHTIIQHGLSGGGPK